MTERITLISDWLAHPRLLDSHEQQHLEVLLKQYPYLPPARWMQAGQGFSEKGFSKEMLNEYQLFSGNWLHFYTSMQDSKNNIAIAKEPIISTDEAEDSINNLPTESTISEEIIVEQLQLNAEENELIQPLYVDNYFQHQGIAVADTLPEIELISELPIGTDDEKSLMVMMGFDEWLLFLKKKTEAQKSEAEDKAQLRSMWQREKLAAAMGEEDDNIPEAVFEMAINSIDKQDIMVSEPLAEIHIKQGKYEKAIEIYRKLSLQNPEKKAYFAAKINHLNKENLS